MKILLTNDDGYQSQGLKLLCGTLSQQHEVYVVAPDSQRSTLSHATSFFRHVTFTQLDDYCGAKVAYITSGTPVDCVKYAHMHFGQFDLLISGPNCGENYGCDVLYSATVAAAEEGVLLGIKSIAISRLGRDDDYQSAVDYVAGNLQQLYAINLTDALLNINVPNLPTEEIKGVKVTRQGGRLYEDYFEAMGDKWYLTGSKVQIDSFTDCDVYWAENGYITITPLTIFSTDFAQMKLLEGLEK